MRNSCLGGTLLVPGTLGSADPWAWAQATPWPRSGPPWSHLGQGAGGAPALCPVSLHCVSWRVTCVRELRTSWAHRCSGRSVPARWRRCPRAVPCWARGLAPSRLAPWAAPSFSVTRPGLDDAGFVVVQESGPVCAARGQWSDSGSHVAGFGWVPSVWCSVASATACRGQGDGQGRAPLLL